LTSSKPSEAATLAKIKEAVEAMDRMTEQDKRNILGNDSMVNKDEWVLRSRVLAVIDAALEASHSSDLSAERLAEAITNLKQGVSFYFENNTDDLNEDMNKGYREACDDILKIIKAELQPSTTPATREEGT
jgi:hypothetical protein